MTSESQAWSNRREREEREKRRVGEKKEERGEGRKKAGEDSGREGKLLSEPHLLSTPHKDRLVLTQDSPGMIV